MLGCTAQDWSTAITAVVAGLAGALVLVIKELRRRADRPAPAALGTKESGNDG